MLAMGIAGPVTSPVVIERHAMSLHHEMLAMGIAGPVTSPVVIERHAI